MPRPPLTRFDKNLRSMISDNLSRLMQGKTQAQLAELSGIPASTISGYISKRSTPNPDQVEKLAKALGVSKSDIDPRYQTDKSTINRISDMLDPNYERLRSSYMKLNQVGQTKVADYAEDLDHSGQYKASSPATAPDDLDED